MINKIKFGSTLIVSVFLVLSSWAINGNCAESVTARENLEKLIKTQKCRGCDLSGVNLNRMDLSGADLEGADLSNAQMSLTDLSGANLRNANLRGVVFGGSDLADADLRGADLRGTSLDGAYLGGALLDGVFISAKLYKDAADEEIKTEVYIDNPSKSKENPKTQEVVVAPRRVFEEPPPAVIVEETPLTDEKSVGAEAAPDSNEAVGEVSYPQAPRIKKPVRPQTAMVAEKTIEPVVTGAEPVAVSSAPEQSADSRDEVQGKPAPSIVAVPVISEPQAAENSVSEAVKDPEPSVAPVEEKIIPVTKPAAEVVTTPVEEKTEPISDAAKEVSPDDLAAEGASGMKNQVLAADKKKRDNLARLFDTGKCYGCDLSGLDMSGKNLDSADLEQADLTDCNLEKADLEEANLKGAILVNANLQGADLREADLYRADLTGADLTGANIKKALFDNARISGAVGLNMEDFLLKE